MKNLGQVAAGAILGTLLVRERNARRAAERMAAAALETLLNAIDANDPQTGDHVRRVASYALHIADAAGLGEAEMRKVERVALFHDIGKIHEALFDIVHEGDGLSEEERRAIATHPARGAEVLAPLRSFYPDLAEGVIAHHERWDGSGYPRGLCGEAIPLPARVVAIADTFDAITYKRRYRSGRDADHAAAVIGAGRGTQFDPDLVDLTLSPPVWQRILKARRSADRKQVRESGSREPHVHDITFRWRTRTVDPSARAARHGAEPTPRRPRAGPAERSR